MDRSDVELADVELADVVRQFGQKLRQSRRLSTVQEKVLRCIQHCRTPFLGGQVYACEHCGMMEIRYHSCRDRHCPKCQSLKQAQWIQARISELLPIGYFHSVFTLPHELNPLIRSNRHTLYRLLFQCVSETLLSLGRDPKRLGGELGLTLVLHTWGQTLVDHVHLHGIVTGGAYNRQRDQWRACRSDYLFPIQVMSRLFRGKFISGLRRLYENHKLSSAPDPNEFKRLLNALMEKPWVVYNKKPFAGPEQVIRYLGQYTHRIAINNRRILKIEGDRVYIRYRDYRDQKTKILPMDGVEMLKRFISHVLPPGFMRIRHYGLLASRNKGQKLDRVRRHLCHIAVETKLKNAGVTEMMEYLTSIDITICSHCRIGKRVLVQTLPAASINHRRQWGDTS